MHTREGVPDTKTPISCLNREKSGQGGPDLEQIINILIAFRETAAPMARQEIRKTCVR